MSKETTFKILRKTYIIPRSLGLPNTDPGFCGLHPKLIFGLGSKLYIRIHQPIYYGSKTMAYCEELTKIRQNRSLSQTHTPTTQKKLT